jgi:DNA polymerase III subunit epsilon
MKMLILGLDFETTSLDTETCEVIEVGAVLWDSEEKKPLALMSELIFGPIVPPEITRITHIHQDDLRFGTTLLDAKNGLSQMVAHTEYIVAHNGNQFDRAIYRRLFDSECVKPWLDTLTDLPYPEEIVTRKLPYLAAELGFLNPFAHRAVFDVLTMLKILSLYDLHTVIAESILPPITIAARVSYSDREKAKTRGYRWNPEKQIWFKTVKQPGLDRELAEAGFPIRVVE